MKIFAFIMLFTMVLFYMIIPGIDEYNKHKDSGNLKAILHALIPTLVYIGLALAGFIMFEIIPRIGEQMLDNIFQ